MIKLCLRVAALLPLAGAIASCGGAAAGGPMAPHEPRASQEEDLGTPEAALAALDRAEANLGLALGTSAPGGYAQPAASAAPPPPPAVAQRPGHGHDGAASGPKPQAPAEPAAEPAPRPVAPAQPTASRVEREAPRTPSDPCSTACSALASMERATDHLCGLAGAADNRCQSARDRVKNASARVHAACPACAR